jgi:hypothetical protein
MRWLWHVALDEMRNDYTILTLGIPLGGRNVERRIILKRSWIQLI